MKYYKLIKDDVFLGAITSNDFIRFSPAASFFLTANEMTGEYIEYEGKLYRTPWMRPIIERLEYEEVEVLEIDEVEYSIYMKAKENNEEVIIVPAEVEVEPESDPNPADIASIEYVRTAKLSEISRACQDTIEHGFDIEIDGKTEHFSLELTDQLNLISLLTMAQTQPMVPYHADGELCKFYTAEQITAIVEAATRFKTYHTTYHNALKNYVKALDDIYAIGEVSYGIELPEAYQSEVLKALMG